MSLTSYLIEGLLPEEEKKRVVAVYGGGFKPPTSGHFEVVKQALKENPEIDEFIILIGGKERDGISPEESILIWDIYKQYLPFKVEVKYTSVPPIKGIYNYAKEHPDEEVLFIIGAREGNEEDFKDISSRTTSLDKYPNLNLRTIVTQGGVSGTAARNASKISLEKFKPFVPSELSDEEVEQVYNIVADKIQENDPEDGKAAPYGSGYKKLNENITKSQLDTLETYADKLFAKLGIDIEFTRHFLDRANDKRNIKPISIPELMGMFKRLHKKHGKPLSKVDNNFDAVVKDFNSNINIPFAINVTPNDIDLVAKTVMRKKDFKTSTPVISLNENASYSQTIDLKKEIAKLTKHMIDKGMNIQPLPKLIFKNRDSENAKQFLGKTAYYDPNSMSIVLYTEGRHPKDIVRSFSHEMVHHTQNLENRLGNITTTNTTEDDHLDKIEQEANLRGTMTFRNWTDSLNEDINEYDNSGPTTPKVYIVKDDGTYKEAPIELLSKISNLTYDMGGGETNYYPEKNIVIVDNIPVEEFAKEPGDIKGEKVYVEYNLNIPTILPKANKIIVSQLVYHLDNPKAFAQTISNSLKDEGTIDFFSDLMSKEDKIFLKYLSSEFGFGIPTTLSKYKNSIIKINKNKYKEIPESSIYKIIDDVGNVSKVSAIKKGSWWKYTKLDGNINFKSVEALDPEYFNLMSGISLSKASEETLDLFSQITHHNIVDVKKIDEPINEKKTKDPFGLNAYARELGQLNEGRYDKSANQFSKIAFEAFKDIHDRGDKEGTFEFSVGPFEEDIYSDQFEFDFEGYVEITDNEYNVDGGANQGFDKKGDEITPLLNLNFKIPKNPTTNPSWEDISFDIKDVVRHELEHLTQGGLNLKGGAWDEDPKLRRPSKQMADDQLIRDLIDADMLPKSQYYKLEKEVDAMLQGLYFKAKKSKRPFKNVINDYLDIFVKQKTISLNDKEDILDLWRSRGKALSLPIFENQKQNMGYKIYSDMDGVLVDFEKGYEKLTGIDLKGEYRPDGENFWKPIEQAGVGYWAGLEWMPDGKQLWSYLKPFNPILLSAPSRSQSSRIGKHVWVKHKIPGTKLILRYASQKQELATPESILIDDRQVNIDQWKAAGGIGILHTSTANTIQQLQKLGL
jgi:hypothetical protein